MVLIFMVFLTLQTQNLQKSGGDAMKRKISNLLYHIGMILVGFVMLYPFLWLVGASFKPNNEIFTTVRNIIPTTWTIEHYIQGWKGFVGYTFTTFIKNSLVIAGLATLGSVLSAALVAFGLARLKFKGSKVWFVAMIVTMMLPGQVLMIPRFVLFNIMGWTGSNLPLIVPAFFGRAFDIFMVMQFIRGIPRELDESARIDGCSWYGIFARIILPLIKPSLITVAVLNFMGNWQDFMGPLLYLNGPGQYTVAYSLKMFNDSSGVSDYGATFAMSVVSLIPILIMFFCFQKQMIGGVKLGAVKG